VDDPITLRLSTLRLGRFASTITVAGPLGRDTAYRLADAVDALPPESTHLLVDLTDLTFVDSDGLAALADAARAMIERGGTATLAIDDAIVIDALAVTGIDRMFTIRRGIDDAARDMTALSLLASLERSR
jgi:anti-anti-sigma factor